MIMVKISCKTFERECCAGTLCKDECSCIQAEKLLKRQQKSERTERHIQEMKRVQELLRLQGTLDSMGSDEVRADFLSGSKGALVS